MLKTKGIDIFHGDEVIQFQLAKKDGVEFVYIKCTESGSLKDVLHGDNKRRAQQSDLLVGDYHFFRPFVDGNKQAHFFLSEANIQPGDLRPCLDLEIYGRGVFDEAVKFVKVIYSELGVYPLLYTDQSFFIENIQPLRNKTAYSILFKCTNYIARYSPQQPSVECDFWQYSETSREPGTPHDLDGDFFFGTLDQLKTKHLYQGKPK